MPVRSFGSIPRPVRSYERSAKPGDDSPATSTGPWCRWSTRVVSTFSAPSDADDVSSVAPRVSAPLRRALNQVGGLGWILGEIVEFGPGARIYFQRLVRIAAQFRPAHVDLGIERLCIRNGRRNFFTGERRTPDSRRAPLLEACPPSDRERSAGNRSSWPAASRASRRELPARTSERDAQRRVVKENAVRVLAVLAQALAVIREHRDQRLVGRGFLSNGIQQSSQLVVRVRDFAVVRPVLVLSA